MLETLAPAKINLYLHVLARRADGYHQIDTLVAFVDVGDELTIAPASSFSLTVAGSFASRLICEPLEHNLVWRAAHRQAELHPLKPPVAFTLTKELPVAAGLGGGSADAGACLRLLEEWWTIEDSSGIHAVAAELGADVPACLRSCSAYLGGCGEVVTLTALPPFSVVLVNPGMAISTAEVFAELGRKFSTPARIEEQLPDAQTLARVLSERNNDLTAPALARIPAIAEVLERLLLTPGCLLARMSGSGASCFGLYPNPEVAKSAAAILSAGRPDWWVRAGVVIEGGVPTRRPPQRPRQH